MTTPMRQQYLSIKAQHLDSILLFRLGDFYETFDEDAKIVARVCDVVLTSRPVGNDQRVPLAGVPYHSIDGYVAKLVEAGYRVAIAEQMSEPGRGLVEREVRRVVSKGTVVDPGMLDARRNNYLVAVTFDNRGLTAGVAYCDITTGEFAAAEVTGLSNQETEQRVGEELSRLHPSELIPVDWQPAQSSIHGLISALAPLISSVEAWQTARDTAAESLKRHFRVASLDGFGLRERPEAVRAAASLLAYLRAMQPAALAQLTQLHSYTLNEFMTLDESTRRNLELVETMRGGEVKGSLLAVLDKTLTPMGARLLRRWLSQPLLDVTAINRRLDAVQELYDQTTARLALREHLRSLGDLERWVNRAMQGIALPRDLMGIREALRKIPDVKRVGEENARGPVANLQAHLARLPDCGEALTLLEAALADEPPANLATPGVIRPGYSAELDGLVERSRHAKDWIANLERNERERLDIKNLKVGYNKVFGYYIEVTSSHMHKVPADYIRKQTIANGERFITPDLKEYESLVLNADERRLEIEQQIFRDLCGQVAVQGRSLLALAAGLAELDVYASLAETALLHRYVRPQVDEGPAIEISAGRHPVVELTLSDEPFVPNDTHLRPETAVQIITGPNMSGKCLTGDSLLFTGRGLHRLEDLMPAEAEEGEFTPIDYAIQGRRGQAQATHFYRGGRQPTIRVTTRLGYQLEGTAQHRLWVRFADGSEGWLRLGEMAVGDYVAIQRQAELWGEETRLGGAPVTARARQYCLPTELTQDFAYLMGLLIGDGTLTYTTDVYLSTADAFIAQEFERICLEQFGCKSHVKQNGKDYFISSRQIRAFLAGLGLGYERAHEKHVPQTILASPRHCVVAFLQGLFDTDGYALRKYGNVEYSTSSLRLAREVQMLLLNLGMITSLRKKNTAVLPNYRVMIYGADAIRFHQVVGFRLPRKQMRSEQASSLRMPNIGGIPHLAQPLKAVQARIAATPNKPVALKRNKRISSIFYTYLPNRRNISYHKLDELMTYCRENGVATPELDELHRNRYFYDPIVEIEYGEAEVYDLSVEPDHAYIANGFVSHNSTYLRQTALITLLAQIGSFVPADQAQVGVVDRIFTRLGASDEIHRGQSTFMVEMVETANILHHATHRSLLILDEIGRGTSTYDGLAIAWAVIEYIHNHPNLRARTLFATHYHELTDLAERLPHVVNYNVAVDDSGDGEDVVFLRRIIPGKADRSYGVHVARMAGLPSVVVNRAEEILVELEKSGAAGPRRLFEPESKRGKVAAVQVGLFAEVHPAVEALRTLDVNSLTPLDALNRLYELQKLSR